MTKITQPILDAYLKAYNDIRDGVPGRHREAHAAGLEAVLAIAPTEGSVACYRPPADTTRALLDGGLKRAFTYGAEWAAKNPIHADMDSQREIAANRFITSFYEPHREPVSDDPIGADPDASGLGTVKHSYDYIVDTIRQCFARSEMPEEFSPNTLRKAAYLIGDLANRLTNAMTEARAVTSSRDAAVVEATRLQQLFSDLTGRYESLATLTPPADPKPTVPGNDAGMREALQPFADCCHNHFHDRSVLDQFEDDESVLCLIRDGKLSPTGISVGDLRRATAALAPQTGSAGEDPKTPDAGVAGCDALKASGAPENCPGSDKPCFFVGSTGYDATCKTCGKHTDDFERNDIVCPWGSK